MTIGGDLTVGGVVHDQYNSILQVILTAKEQYEEEKDDDVQELILEGDHGGGKHFDKRSSYGGSDDDGNDCNKSPPSLSSQKLRSMTKTNGGSKKHTISASTLLRCQAGAWFPHRSQARLPPQQQEGGLY